MSDVGEERDKALDVAYALDVLERQAEFLSTQAEELRRMGGATDAERADNQVRASKALSRAQAILTAVAILREFA